jgi:hypothetical protein
MGPGAFLQQQGHPREMTPPKARSQDHAAAVTPRQGDTWRNMGMAVTFFLKRAQKPALNIRSGFAQVQVPLDY